MKRKTYLIGGAFIILAMVTTSFYLNKRQDQKNNNRDVAGGIAPVEETTAAVDNYSQNYLIVDDQIAMTTASNGATTAILKNRHTQHKSVVVVPADESLLLAAEIPVHDELYVNVDGIETPVTAETQRDYFGKFPATNKKLSDKKTGHKTFRLPDNMLGLEIGYSQSSLDNNHLSGIPIGSINVGLLVNVGFGDHFAIQPGIKYMTKGNRLQSTVNMETNEKLSLHYLEVPVNLVFKFGNVGNARIMVGAGPYVAYMVGAKDKFRTATFTDGTDVIPSTPQYSINSINKFDWGIGGFIGCQSPDGIFAKAGVEAGMMDIMKNTDGSYSNRNTSFMVTVGYILGGN